MPHLAVPIIRHTFASHLAMANVDPLTIKELLGHSELKTTQIYMHLAENHKRSAVNVLNFSSHPEKSTNAWRTRSSTSQVAD